MLYKVTHSQNITISCYHLQLVCSGMKINWVCIIYLLIMTMKLMYKIWWAWLQLLCHSRYIIMPPMELWLQFDSTVCTWGVGSYRFICCWSGSLFILHCRSFPRCTGLWLPACWWYQHWLKVKIYYIYTYYVQSLFQNTTYKLDPCS